MKLQEFFEKAYKGIIAQGGPGFDGEKCMYHAVVGGKELRCSVGQVLGPRAGAVETVWGAARVLWPDVEKPEGYEAFNEHDFSVFLMGLQDEHDAAVADARPHDSEGRQGAPNPAKFLESFRERMASFASRWMLTVPSDNAT